MAAGPGILRHRSILKLPLSMRALVQASARAVAPVYSLAISSPVSFMMVSRE